MEAMKMKLFVAVVMMLMAVSAVQNVAAAEAPAPTPTADATAFVPTAFASIAALAFDVEPETLSMGHFTQLACLYVLSG
ncbi:Arabinogalactan protein 14 [Camellia lanceoleosa]|uniref:Arabinogalactan protein 14 n=1 Tax=Camellia lanceoleosa TaxID=1840588 RepID=A0ACC0G7D8_9ERIC|nr:Arabinogalactan protein 14 [Camellia lanceoleosa]